MADIFLWGLGSASILLAGASARWNWWRLPAQGLPILMYHKVGIPPRESRLKSLWVSPSDFEKQMDYLTVRGYTTLTFRDLHLCMQEGRAFPEKAVTITFDDGYANNYESAYPVLLRKGMKAVFFIVVHAMGQDNFWHDPAEEVRIPMMTWKQIKEMKFHGMEIASHTLAHANLLKVAETKAKEEISESQNELSQILGETPISFAYPYGSGQDSEKIQTWIRDVGYAFACGIHQGKAKIGENPFCLKRIFVRGGDFMVDFHLNMTRGKARL